ATTIRFMMNSTTDSVQDSQAAASCDQPSGLPAKPSQSNPTVSNAPSGTSHIRSFVHRRSHITQGQQEALEKLLPQWSITYRNELLATAAAFGRLAPVILEIGFGMGETTQ